MSLTIGQVRKFLSGKPDDAAVFCDGEVVHAISLDQDGAQLSTDSADADLEDEDTTDDATADIESNSNDEKSDLPSDPPASPEPALPATVTADVESA